MLSGGRQRTDGLLGDHGLNRGLSLDEPAPTDLGAQHLDCVAVIGVGLSPCAMVPPELSSRPTRTMAASPELRPLMRKAATLYGRTRMPVSRAASSLLPIA